MYLLKYIQKKKFQKQVIGIIGDIPRIDLQFIEIANKMLTNYC